MLSKNFSRRYNWRVFLTLINRYSERSQHLTHDALTGTNLDTDSDQVNNKTDKNNVLVKNIKAEELLHFSPPKAFDEIPLCDDPEKLDFHPAEFIDRIEPPLPNVKQSETLAKLGEELLHFSPPKPFDEIPLCDDPEELDFHPAEFIDRIGPPLPISFNLAAYVNQSETLTKLVQLGVDLSKMDIYPKKAKFILKLDFDKDIKNHILFLHDHGIENDDLGKCITKNPFIFKEDLEDLEIRINYLKSKKFSDEAIARIITGNPLVLNMSTKSVDSRLGFFQKQFSLTGNEVRHIFTKCPKIVSYDHAKFLEKIFITKEVFGFEHNEIKKLLIMKPKVWMLGSRVLKERFDIVHNVMKLSHERILEFPGILLKRTFLLRERHEYLVHLNRAQYDPTKPNFVSLYDIATTTDYQFCKKCALTSVDQYNEFLKTR